MDTWDFIYGALEYTLNTHNYPIPSKEVINKMTGKPLKDFYKVIFPNQDVQLFAQTHIKYQSDRFNLSKPFPNTVKTLKQLREKEYLIAIISNRSRESLLESLEKAKISKFIDLIVSAEDVINPKPHKDHVLSALKKLKVEPENVYMVGDTHHDILAGKNAGVKTVGVTYGFLGKDIKTLNPDFVIDDIRELISIVS